MLTGKKHWVDLDLTTTQIETLRRWEDVQTACFNHLDRAIRMDMVEAHDEKVLGRLITEKKRVSAIWREPPSGLLRRQVRAAQKASMFPEWQYTGTMSFTKTYKKPRMEDDRLILPKISPIDLYRHGIGRRPYIEDGPLQVVRLMACYPGSARRALIVELPTAEEIERYITRRFSPLVQGKK